jgi:hypothetical protein
LPIRLRLQHVRNGRPIGADIGPLPWRIAQPGPAPRLPMATVEPDQVMTAPAKNRCVHRQSKRGGMHLAIKIELARLLPLVRSTSVLLAFASLVDHAVAQDASFTVYGEGSGSRNLSGQFSAQLPDGTHCTANFSGGKLSLFGHSAVRTSATCTNGTNTQSVPTVVYRWPNGLPRQAILRFNNGTTAIVVIPRAAAHKTPR